MLLTGELRKVDSCSVTARYTDAYDQLFSSYLWLRVAVLQILPALVLSCCNIVLIRASYTTYAYRKRLIGAMGAVEGFNPSFVIDVDPSSGSTSRRQSRFPDCVDRRKSSGETMMTESSSHRNSTNGGLVHILNNIVHHKNSSIGIMTDHEDKNHGSSNGIIGTHLWAENSVMADHDSGVASHSGGESEVLAERPSAVDHDAHSCLGNKHCGEEKAVDAGRTFDLRQTEDGVMNEREGCGKEQAGSAYTRDAVHAWEDPVIDENAAVSHNDQQGKDNSAEQIPVTWEPREEAGRAGAHRASSEETTTKRKDSGVYWADFLRETMVTNGNYPHHSCREDSLPQSRSSDRIHGEKNGFLHPQPIRQILSSPALKSGENSTTSERHRSFKRSSDALNRQSARNSKAQLQRGGERQKECVYRDLEQQSRKISFPLNFSIKGRKSGSSQLSRKLSFYRMSAELRSSVMLILVTSCTLVAEVFVIILLIFKFVTSVVLPGGEFITYTELANLIMISNIVTIITFPLNFAFFCGLSQAFRSTVREKLVALTRICNRQSS